MELELQGRDTQRAGDARSATAFSPALGLDIPLDSALEFCRIADAPFGVEVRGITWQRPTPDTVRLVTAALRRGLLLVMRGQAPPDDDELDEFFRGFGRLVLDTEDGQA